jgi:molybdopterin converting factor subunit 1
MQIVHVRLFARFRDIFRADVVQLDLPSSTTVGELRSILTKRQPESTPLLSRSQIAVNDEFAADDTIIHSDDEIALIPPVSGG